MRPEDEQKNGVSGTADSTASPDSETAGRPAAPGPERASRQEAQRPPAGGGTEAVQEQGRPTDGREPPQGAQEQSQAAQPPQPPQPPAAEQEAGAGAQEETQQETQEGTQQEGAAGESETARLTTELEQAQALAEENYDKFVRLRAEMENYKKRMQKERAEESKYAELPLLRDLAGILDNLERAAEHARNNPVEGTDGILSGVEMVAKQLNETFERHGMKRIQSMGEAFDPTRHEAMGLVETDDVPENQVVEEYQAGYFLHDRVVKPAMVTVSKKPDKATPEEEHPKE